MQKADEVNDYNHMAEIEGIQVEPLSPEEQQDKSLKAHKIFKMIVIGDTGKCSHLLPFTPPRHR